MLVNFLIDSLALSVPSKRSRLARGLPAEFFPYYEFARALLSRRFSMFHVMRLLYGHINLNYVIN